MTSTVRPGRSEGLGPTTELLRGPARRLPRRLLTSFFRCRAFPVSSSYSLSSRASAPSTVEAARLASRISSDGCLLSLGLLLIPDPSRSAPKGPHPLPHLKGRGSRRIAPARSVLYGQALPQGLKAELAAECPCLLARFTAAARVSGGRGMGAYPLRAIFRALPWRSSENPSSPKFAEQPF